MPYEVAAARYREHQFRPMQTAIALIETAWRQTFVHTDAHLGLVCLSDKDCPMETTKVGIREFRSGLAQYIASDTPVAVTHHGQTVGYFIPTHGKAEEEVAALRRAAGELDRLLAAHSVDIEAVAADFKAARKMSAADKRSARLFK
jgi:hypothetical protein